MKYVLTLDVGTTAVKAGLFSEHLESISFATREYRLLTPGPDQIEMDPDVYWAEAKAAIRAAVAQAAINPQDIISITCTTQGETLIPIGKEKRHLSNAIVWLDSRAKAEADFISEGFEKIAIYQVTGLPEINGYCPIAKVLWVKNNLPEIYAKTEKFLLLEDFLILRLCGIYTSNPPLMCSTGYFNIHTDTLWEEVLLYCGISKEKFPAIAASGTIVGDILESVSEELGLSPEVKVTTGAMDQVASAVGSGNTALGIVSETTGTAQVVAATCEKNVPEQWSPVTIYRHAVADAFLKIVINQTAGMAYKWFRDEFCIDLVGSHEDAFDVMGELAEKEPAGSRGLIFFPHLTGMQFPKSDESLRGVFFGVGLDTNRGCFIRSIMEGVGFMLRESIEEMKLQPERIISMGGGAKSALWCQIKADISGIKIAVLKHAESTSLGAAVMGCVAMGIYSDYQTAAKDLEKKNEFHPIPENHSLYQPAYAEYRAMYGLFSPLFKNRKNRS